MRFIGSYLTFILNLPIIIFLFVLTFDDIEIQLPEKEAPSIDEEITTKIIGSGDPEDPCVVEVESSVVADLEKMGIENWVDACVEAQSVKQTSENSKEPSADISTKEQGTPNQ